MRRAEKRREQVDGRRGRTERLVSTKRLGSVRVRSVNTVPLQRVHGDAGARRRPLAESGAEQQQTAAC